MSGNASVPRLVLRGRPVDLSAPLLMGIVNATPDSFSDGGLYTTTAAQVDRALELVEAGAGIVDVGGQSGITGVPEVPVGDEVARVLPLVEQLRTAAPEVLISVDTYRPEVVQAVVDAGADLVNDISGLRHPEVAKICAAAGAGLVVMHTRARPKEKVLDPALYGSGEGVVDDVVSFLAERLAQAGTLGLPVQATVVDPGPDFAKTPHQTVQVLRHLDRVVALGRPVLLALSRKDFIGALTGRPPQERLGGTLAAIGWLAGVPGGIFRVHDVAEVADYLQVSAALAGREVVAPGLELPRHLRRQPSTGN